METLLGLSFHGVAMVGKGADGERNPVILAGFDLGVRSNSIRHSNIEIPAHMRKNLIIVIGNNIILINYVVTNILLKNYCDGSQNYLY